VKRRTAIKTLGALAGAAATSKLLGGCGSEDGPGEEGITTIVALMMENRSYDHYLGARHLLEGEPSNGLTAGMKNPRRGGPDVEILAAGADLCIPDPPHSWTSSRTQFGNGANDGFMVAYQDRFGDAIAPHPMAYMTREHLPVTWALADGGTSCDAWFCSVMGPTWPNRFYWHSATSRGISRNELADGGSLQWPTIYHRLDDAGIPWAYYYSDLPVVGLWGNLELEGRIRRVMWDFFDDAAAGKLPPVVFLDPSFASNDDHPPHHPLLGQQFIASVYRALAESPQWNNILFAITYDEHGGFFDHVPPPKTADDYAAEGFDQLGFRVPGMVLGPYAKQGYVSSVTYDHTSVLAHIESMFGLEPLTARDAAANDLSDCIDMQRLADGAPAPPTEIPAVEVDESMLDAACLQRISGQTDLELLADSGFFPAKYDARGDARDLLHGVAEVLDRMNSGRARRGR
jgi:phospholipase C